MYKEFHWMHPVYGALSTSICRKEVFRNIKDETILKVFKSNLLQIYEKNTGDLVVDLRKNNQGRPPNISVRQKRYMLHQTKCLQEKMRNLCLHAGIALSNGEETARRVLGKTDLKWTPVQTKGILTKMI